MTLSVFKTKVSVTNLRKEISNHQLSREKIHSENEYYHDIQIMSHSFRAYAKFFEKLVMPPGSLGITWFMDHNKRLFILCVRKISQKTNISYRLIRTRTCTYQR